MSNARDHTRGLRIASVAALVVVVMAVFGALGGIGLAQSAIGLAQYQYGKKVTICHKGRMTIRVSFHAWPAHQRHGDTLGPCAPPPGGGHGKHGGKRHGHQDNQGPVQFNGGGGDGGGNGNGDGNANGNGLIPVQGGHGHGHGRGNGQSPGQADNGRGNGNGHGGNNGQ